MLAQKPSEPHGFLCDNDSIDGCLPFLGGGICQSVRFGAGFPLEQRRWSNWRSAMCGEHEMSFAIILLSTYQGGLVNLR